MRVTRAAVTRTCAVCERSLLMGELTTRYLPNGGEYVDVCPLCQDIAVEHGWVREGSPTTPTGPGEAHRRRPRPRRPPAPAPPLAARAGDRRVRGPLQLEPAPAHGCRHRQEPRRAEGLDRAALRRLRRDGRDRRLGDLLVPVPRDARLRAAGAPRRARLRPRGPRAELPRLERADRRGRRARARSVAGLTR